MDLNEIEFLNDNPGAVRFGNFINYYKFHPAEQRIKLLPANIWEMRPNDTYLCLDIGCNSGDLTIALHDFLRQNLKFEQPIEQCKFLGLDVDPTLILRAKELCKNKTSFQFECFNIMTKPLDYLTNYLSQFSKTHFNVSFCFSVTMWIHLNHGDNGLEMFLKTICDVSEMVVVEPQPWKCYKTAVKRLKQANKTFPLFGQIKQRKNIEIFIKQVIENYDFHLIYQSPVNEWGRQILFYKRN